MAYLPPSRPIVVGWRCLLQQLRTSVNWKARNPRDPHFDRKRMLEVCKPIHPIEIRNSWEICALNTVLPQSIEAHPYHKMLAEEFKQNWAASRMICFFHINPMGPEVQKKIRNTFFKKDMFFHIYPHEVVNLSLQDTSYSSVLHLFQSNSALLFSAECSPVHVSQLLKLSKKITQAILMAAVIDGVFYSRKHLEDYSKLPSKDVLYQQLSCLLNTKAANISGIVTHHTELLSHYLKQVSEDTTKC